jgi:hypothetical protein
MALPLRRYYKSFDRAVGRGSADCKELGKAVYLGMVVLWQEGIDSSEGDN